MRLPILTFYFLFLTKVILGMRLHLHNYVILKKHGSRLMRQNINFLWWWGWYRTIHLECLTSFKKLTKKARSVPRKADMKAPPKMRKKYRRLSWENNILTRKNIAASYIRTSFHSASPVDDNISIRQHVPTGNRMNLKINNDLIQQSTMLHQLWRRVSLARRHQRVWLQSRRWRQKRKALYWQKGSASKDKLLMQSILIKGTQIPVKAMKKSSCPKSKEVTLNKYK